MKRLATVDDFSQIKKIANQNRDTIGFIMKQSLIDAIDQQALFVFEDNNEILGFVRFYRRRDGWNTLHEIAIRKNCYGQGIGQVLFDAVPLPIRLKTTFDNENAIRFYEKNGMTHVRTEKGRKRELFVFEKK